MAPQARRGEILQGEIFDRPLPMRWRRTRMQDSTAPHREAVVTPPKPSPTPLSAAYRRAAALVRRLALEPAGRFPHPVERVEVVETHISWVLLTGPFAYKIKKPVNLGFLDFGTLARRHRFSEEELGLNRRLAPELYLAVLPVVEGPRGPRIATPEEAAGTEAVEWALQMRQFPREARLDRVLEAGRLSRRLVEETGRAVARLHRQAPAAGGGLPYGRPDQVLAPMRQNFEQLAPLLAGGEEAVRLERLRRWTLERHQVLEPLLRERRREGRVREVHGDLHLANLVLLEGRVVPFDCIEFDEALRWIDVLSDAAFLMMDLAARGHPGLAWRFLDAYLQETGDYAGLGVLPLYLVYRAMVRAKVAALRDAQEGRPPGEACAAYLALAEDLARPRPTSLVLTHGLPGSGKSTLAGELLETLGAVRLRSDVERKRLAGLEPLARSGSAPGGGLYGEAMTRRTYARLLELARGVLEAGLPCIVDAAFLQRARRAPFRELARELGVPLVILRCEAPEPELRRRLAARRGDASEADAAVLALQRRRLEPLSREEADQILTVRTACTGEAVPA